MDGFMGCLTDLVLGNERVGLLQEASEGRNVDYCDWDKTHQEKFLT